MGEGLGVGLFLLFHNQYSGICRYSLHTSSEAKLLGCGSLNRHIIYICLHNVGKTALHIGDMRIELWTLGTYSGVDIAKTIAFGRNKIDGLTQQYLAVYVESLGSSIGKMIAYIAHIGSSKQCIANGVNKHIGIAMTKQTKRIVETYASEPQFAALYKFMDVVSKSSTKYHEF